MRLHHPLRVVPVVVGAIAALLYSNFLIDWVLRGFTGMREVVSYLESPGAPNATLLRVTDVVCAVLVISLLPAVRRFLPAGAWREVAIWLTVTFAVGSALAGIVAEPCAEGQPCGTSADRVAGAVHGLASTVSDAALFFGIGAVWLLVRTSGPVWLRRVAAWEVVVGGVVTSLVFLWFHLYPDPDWVQGAAQRAHILCIAAWIVCLGVMAAGAPRSDRSQRAAAAAAAARANQRGGSP